MVSPGCGHMTIVTSDTSDLVTWLAGCLGRGESVPLPCADIAEFADHLTEQSYAGGTMIYERHAPPERVHILRTGRVELTRDLGGRSAVLQLLHPGSVFGDVAMFLRTGEPTGARAVEDCVVASIDSVVLFGLLGRRPLLARRWLVSLADRMAAMQDRVGDLLAGGLDRQVASWLVREGTGAGIAVSQLTLARLLGARRTSVNQSLRRLEAAGYITTGYRRIAVVDRPGLLDMMAGD